MHFNIIFKTIFECIHKKFRFMYTSTFCKYRKKLLASPRVHLVSSFFLYGKKLPYVVTRDVCPSVCPSVRPSVCPSSVEISLERGCSITNMPIDLKFGTIIGGRVMHVWKKFGFEIRIASCEFMQFKFFFVITVLTNLLFLFSWYLTYMYLMR